MSTYWNRILRAAKLDSHLYEEVEADPDALTQAMGVVVLASLAAGIGSAAQLGVGGLLMGTISALAGWYIWALLIYLIGTRLLPEPQTHSTQGELLRTIGFASAPGLIRIFGIIKGLTGLLFLVASFWMLAAMVIAVRQALDYTSTWRAIGVCLIGWLVQALFLFAILALTGNLTQ